MSRQTTLVLQRVILSVAICTDSNTNHHTMVHELNDKMLPKCYLGGCEGEIGEREVASAFTGPTATRPSGCQRVLELGGGSGSVSTVIQQRLKNPELHVVVQPRDETMFGGVQKLQANKEACNSSFHIVDHVLKPGEEDYVVFLLKGYPDCLVADCEDCLVNEYNKNPGLFREVQHVQVERDDPHQNYTKLLRDILRLSHIHTGRGCGVDTATEDMKRNGMLCTTEVWERK